MLSLLLDEHVPSAVAAGLREREPAIPVVILTEWQRGAYREAADHVLLTVAHREGKTLLTYDQRTIIPLLKSWGEQGISHGGVIFVSSRTIPSQDVGSLVRALGTLWDELGHLDWTDRVVYLRSRTR